MRKVSILLIFSVFVALLLQTSCSIEKRHYRSGFYVDNGFTKNTKSTIVEKQINNEVALKINKTEPLSESVAETEHTPIFHQSAEEHLINAATPKFAHKINVKTKETHSVTKQLNKSEAIKALKENTKALAFYAKSQKANSKGGGGEQIVALLLCFFLGFLGIHSFYLGNKKKGIWQLVMFLVGILTFFFIIGYVILVALSIWVLIDFIRIIIGDLGPGW